MSLKPKVIIRIFTDENIEKYELSKTDFLLNYCHFSNYMISRSGPYPKINGRHFLRYSVSICPIMEVSFLIREQINYSGR